MVLNDCISNSNGFCTDFVAGMCKGVCQGMCEHYSKKQVNNQLKQIDSYGLLKKYMKHVHNNASTYYLSDGYDSFYSDVIQELFTKQEWEELKRISKEI